MRVAFGWKEPKPLDRHQLALWRGRVSAEFAVDNLTRAFRDVLLALAEYATCKRGIFPAQGTLATDACCSVPTVQRALAQGRRLGLLDWAPQWRSVGWRRIRTTNRYVLLLPGTPLVAGKRGKAIRHQKAGGTESKKESTEIAKKWELAQLIRETTSSRDLLQERRDALPGILMAARRQKLSESRLC